MLKVSSFKDVAHVQLGTGKSLFSLSAVLSEPFAFEKLFVHHEILKTGRKASAPHAHTENEEMIIVLEGRPTVRTQDGEQELTSGDAIGFLPNIMHWIENNNLEDAHFLVISSRDIRDRITYSK